VVKLARHMPNRAPLSQRKNVLIWCMEHLCAIADRDADNDGTVCIVFDMNGYTSENVDLESASTMVDILQRQYPERCGQVFIIQPPIAFTVVWTVIWPFLNSRTRAKIETLNSDSDLTKLHAVVPTSILPRELKGHADWVPFKTALGASVL
jgi:CRAL/TRIO domain